MTDNHEALKSDLRDKLIEALHDLTGYKWTYSADADLVLVDWGSGYYHQFVSYLKLDNDPVLYARWIVENAKRYGFPPNKAGGEPGKAIIIITPAMIERLINDGAISVEGLTGNATIDRFWIRQDVSPSGEIYMVVSGEGLPRVCNGGEFRTVPATINQP